MVQIRVGLHEPVLDDFINYLDDIKSAQLDDHTSIPDNINFIGEAISRAAEAASRGESIEQFIKNLLILINTNAPKQLFEDLNPPVQYKGAKRLIEVCTYLLKMLDLFYDKLGLPLPTLDEPQPGTGSIESEQMTRFQAYLTNLVMYNLELNKADPSPDSIDIDQRMTGGLKYYNSEVANRVTNLADALRLVERRLIAEDPQFEILNWLQSVIYVYLTSGPVAEFVN